MSPFEHFNAIRDPRQPWKVEHSLADIILLSVCAVIAGSEGWEEIEDFGHSRLDWLKDYGDFKHGIPAHDTIARVMSNISPKRLQKCFVAWMESCHQVTDGEVIAIDGKVVRGSYDKSRRKGAIHMISAFSTANSLVLGQLSTDEKSNEITAIPKLLELLVIKGCLITIDAMGCQHKIAEKIIEKEGDYLLAVKGNQKRLLESFQKHFSAGQIAQFNGDSYVTKEKSRDRKECRYHVVSDLFDDFVDHGFAWKGMKRVCAVMSFRSQSDEVAGAEEVLIRYYITSADLSAKEFAEAVRAHWRIETTLHWKLDTAMREDACRIRRGDAAENLAGVRHIAYNLLSNETSFKAGLRRKQKRAAMSEAYLAQVLAG